MTGRHTAGLVQHTVPSISVNSPIVGVWARTHRAHETTKPPGLSAPAAQSSICERRSLDRIADRAQDLADLAAQEDEGDDRDDRDKREDQGVLGESLAFVIVADVRLDESDELIHVFIPSFLRDSTNGRGSDTLSAGRRRCQPSLASYRSTKSLAKEKTAGARRRRRSDLA